jgi:enediyne biosynthesis protein E4
MYKIIAIIIIAFTISCKKKDTTLFTLMDHKDTGILFNNSIPDTDSNSILDNEYIYNGGGVALADFNNDGLDDIFFTGNKVGNSLYANKGNLKFTDVTSQAGIAAKDVWNTGVAIVDINQDGKKDIFITNSIHTNVKNRTKKLFINQSSGDSFKFVESAAAYGLADTSFSTNSAFFDYDNDGDLDLYIINNRMEARNDVMRYRREKDDSTSYKIDRLYRNDFDPKLGHSYFTNVTRKAGITHEGYSLGINVCDINKDGYKDLYICNDFISNDLLYINNKNGTFTNKINDYVNHTCFSAMGADIVDINNDGLEDIIAVDMLPEDNYRKKTMMGANNYSAYLNNQKFDYTYQMVRNVLQLNRGKAPGKDHPIFSEIAMMAGIEATDWSWTPLVADYDADGYRDMIITNGFPKDITDRDFTDYQSEYMAYISKKEMLSKIPEVKIKNYAYKNNGDLTFSQVNESWGLTKSSFSNGAAYGDLDNDGDLDYVVNNINDYAHIYKNNTTDQKSKNHYLKIKLKGASPNIDAEGTTIDYASASHHSIVEHRPSRGYLSAVSSTLFIGLGQDSTVSLSIRWPDGNISTIQNVKANQTLTIDYNKVAKSKEGAANVVIKPIFFTYTAIPQDSIAEVDAIDFNFDPLLLKKQSNFGPGIAVGDVNNDGNDDYYIVGSKSKKGRLYLSKGNGYQMENDLPIPEIKEEIAPLFFDVENDGDLDLYIGCGSNEFNTEDINLKDELLINEKGKWISQNTLPVANTNTACVKAADYDNDGDLDLFIGGGAIPNKYPLHESSFILKNNSTKGNISFSKEVTITTPSVVQDALWTDVDNDGWTDLITIGEWSAIKVFKNHKGILKPQNSPELETMSGWWSSINGADLDQDGDIDYVVGNLGSNTLLRPTVERPVRLYHKDYDKNGSYDFIPTTYYKDQQGAYAETPYHVKGDLIKELIGIRKKFVYHSQIAKAPIDSIISKKDAKISVFNYNKSIMLLNDGKGHFTIKALPNIAQLSPIYGTEISDLNNDGLLDIYALGNNYGMELGIGRMDASYGILLLGNGKADYIPASLEETGVIFSNDTRALAKIKNRDHLSYIVTAHSNKIQAFTKAQKSKIFVLPVTAKKIDFLDTDSKLILRQEQYWGNGYLSQSSRYLSVPNQAVSVNMYHFDGRIEKQTIVSH